jgi:hypothetical protein
MLDLKLFKSKPAAVVELAVICPTLGPNKMLSAQFICALAGVPAADKHADDDVEPVLGLYLPVSHVVHDDAPVVETYVPGLQSMHCDAPVVETYVPGLQSMHCDAPVVETYVPALHALQMLNQLRKLAYRPAVQLGQQYDSGHVPQ